MRGFCGIGIVNCKTKVNVGTLWRSATLLGADFIFTVAERYKRQSSDTQKAWRHMPLWHFSDFADLKGHLPFSCRLVAVELDDEARFLADYVHPERAVYLLGAEDGGLPSKVVAGCHDIVRLPGETSLNVATAGSIVLYDRLTRSEA